MLNYFRNYLMLIFAQSAIVQFCLNNTIVPRFQMEPFQYYEILLLCVALFVITHSYRTTLMLNTVEIIKEMLAACGLVQLHSTTSVLKRLDDIQNKLDKTNSDDKNSR